MNIDNGQIVPWDSLSAEQKESGRWVKLTEGEHAIAKMIGEEKGHAVLDAIFERLRKENDRALVDAINKGENHYRQTVLGQGPLPGYPVIERSAKDRWK